MALDCPKVCLLALRSLKRTQDLPEEQLTHLRQRRATGTVSIFVSLAPIVTQMFTTWDYVVLALLGDALPFRATSVDYY